eukprot:354999_1
MSQHTIDNITNISLSNVCSEFVEKTIGDTIWNEKYINDHLGNATVLQCLNLQHFTSNISGNNSIPDEVSLYLLNGSNTNTTLELIPNNITNTENSCDAIVVNLNWNTNNKHDTNKYIPQCVYHASPPWRNDLEYGESVNDKCVPIYHDEQNVKCACQSFGSYSTSVQQKFHINVQETLSYFDPWTIIISTAYLFLLCIFMEKNCRSCCCDRKNDNPLVSLEVYLPNRIRHRMWVVTREGRTHFLLRYKFEKSKNKNMKKIWHIFQHFIRNDGLIVPYFKRERGPNHYTVQRLINLFWLIITILTVTVIITACNNNINPKYCEYGKPGYVGTDIFCMKSNEISIAMIFVIILCGCHFIHRLIFQRIHPNKLQMDLHALAVMELKRYHKQCRSPSISPKRLIKNRYSKLEQTPKDTSIKPNDSMTVKFNKIVSNIKNIIKPHYFPQPESNTDQFNEEDIRLTQQYLKEIEKHRQSILEAPRFEPIDYYYDGSQNNNMLRLDYGNDGDIEEESDEVELELKCVDISDYGNEHNTGLRRPSQECNHYNIGQLNYNNAQETIIEKDENEESDESVATAVVSAGSKRSSIVSNTSDAPISVNSLSARGTSERPERPTTARNINIEDCNEECDNKDDDNKSDELAQHQRTNTRNSVSIHESEDENNEEEKMSHILQRNRSHSFEYSSPSQRGRRSMIVQPSNNSLKYFESPQKGRTTSFKSSKSSLDTNHILDTVTDAEYLGTPSHGVNSNIYNITPNSAISLCHSGAPEPPSPLNELITHQNDITPAPSPKLQYSNQQVEINIGNEENKNYERPESISVEVNDINADQNDITPASSPRHQYTDQQLEIKTQNEENNNYERPQPINVEVNDINDLSNIIEVTPPSTDHSQYEELEYKMKHEERNTNDDDTYTKTHTNNDTFIIKQSDIESSDDDTNNNSTPTNTINNNENINANIRNNEPITPPIQDVPKIEIKHLNDEENTVTDTNITSLNSITHPITYESINKPDIMPEIKESFHESNDSNENDDQISELSVTFNASTTITSYNNEKQMLQQNEMHDIILPQEEPTKPEMRAPRPMLHNNNNNNKKDRHTYSYSYHKVNLNISRTDFGIYASG